MTEEVTAIFADMGFSVAEGPQIESDWYNFDALNIPDHHPARAEMDTFYMARAEGDNRPPHVLRTHTSPVQIRRWNAGRAVPRDLPGPRLPRRLRPDPHADVPPGRGAGDRQGHLHGEPEMGAGGVLPAFFEVDDVELRFRASHFPFTEPSAEVDIRCSWEGGQLKIGEGDDWLEILGSGMVHPKVLAAGGIDPDEWIRALPSAWGSTGSRC